MKGKESVHRRFWVVPGLILLIAGHGILLHLWSHAILPATVISGVIALVVVKHLELLGPVYALFRRRSGRHER